MFRKSPSRRPMAGSRKPLQRTIGRRTLSRLGAGPGKLGAGLAGLAMLAGASAIVSGCLDRPVKPDRPRTTNVFVDQIVQTAVNKIDLLFVIDNSISMADKQEILQAAVPSLLSRLVNPPCVDPEGNQVGPGPNCQGNSELEFSAIEDIHIGVISSSLGGHGGTICSETDPVPDPTHRDNAHLIASVRANIASYNSLGFLAWDPTGEKNNPPGEANLDGLIGNFADMVGGAGEDGCGYEATLESWYRFLVDPEPPQNIVVVDSQAGPEVDGNGNVIIDQVVLDQRAAFLRYDSLVAVIMLSDENDCSIQDRGVAWLTSDTTFSAMPRSTSQCATNPNDPCCRPCARTAQTAAEIQRCGDRAQDAQCQMGSGFLTPSTSANLPADGSVDHHNMRCFKQKARFGFDLLYPASRYVDALKQTTVNNRRGEAVPNPLFVGPGPDGAETTRDPSLVFLAGIVGVPWQDIATQETINEEQDLTYLTARQMEAEGIWDLILGDPNANPPVLPRDPLMVESIIPRTELNIPQDNPRAGVSLVDSNSTDPEANAINGHEYNNPDFGDLQYACIFPLGTPKNCAPGGDDACDCTAADLPKNSPLCNPPPPGGAATEEQNYAKAYPGLRHLEVLKGFGDNSIVASICPKNTGIAQTDPNYGYNPAVAAIIDRLKDVLKGRCLPRRLAVVDGRVPCAVVESRLTQNCTCDAGEGRLPVNEKLVVPVHEQLQELGRCGGDGIACNSYCLCEIAQLEGDQQDDCETQLAPPPNIAGYCYVDEDAGIGNPNLVADCPETSRRKLIFAGDIPAQGAVAFIACIGAPLVDETADP